MQQGSPKNLVGASTLPTGKFLRVRKVFARIYKIDPKIKSKHCISLESFRTVWKVSKQSGKFPDILESFQIVYNFYNFPNSVNIFRTVWKVSRGMCAMYAKAIYAYMAHLCHKSYLRTFGAFLSRKRFTRFVRKVFAREILPTGKF